MARYLEIESKDFDRLVAAVRYVIERYRGKDDSMVRYLVEQLSLSLHHVENESLGEGDETVCEITQILDFIDPKDGQE